MILFCFGLDSAAPEIPTADTNAQEQSAAPTTAAAEPMKNISVQPPARQALPQWAQPLRISSESPCCSASQPTDCTGNMASLPVTTALANQSHFMGWPLAQLIILERSKSSSIKFCQFNTPS